MNVHDVFTPDGYPEYTYVERDHGEHEENLKFHLQSPATIVSLSGPSKAGKTMLINNVIDRLDYQMVTVHGSNITSVESLWDNVLDQLKAPTNRKLTEGTHNETEKKGTGGLNTYVVNASAEGTQRSQDSRNETTQHGRRGLKQIEDIVDLDKFVLYIDDAHYINEEHHRRISEGIKEAYEKACRSALRLFPTEAMTSQGQIPTYQEELNRYH